MVDTDDFGQAMRSPVEKFRQDNWNPMYQFPGSGNGITFNDSVPTSLSRLATLSVEE
jgi:hypothetical protein